MNKSLKPFECTVQVIRETEKAFLVTQGLKGPGNKLLTHWLPKSQCSWPDGEPEPDATLTVELPEWLALEKGLT